MLRFSSQTIHGIMFPDGRLRQTFFFSFFLVGIRVQNMATSFFQGPVVQKMDSAIHRRKEISSWQVLRKPITISVG